MKLLLDSIKLFQKKWLSILISYIIVTCIGVCVEILHISILRLPIVLSLAQTFFSAMLFTAVYRIIFENCTLKNSFQFDFSLLVVFIGFINLNFIVFIVEYIISYGSSINNILLNFSKIIIHITTFIFCFYPAVALKGNMNFIEAGKKSINLIQEGSNSLIGLFILYGISIYLLRQVPFDLQLAHVLSVYAIQFLNLGIILTGYRALIESLLGGLFTIIITIMIQKYTKYS